MSAPDVSLIQANVMTHVTAALGAANWTFYDGAPRGYRPPQVNVWWTGVRLDPPMEVQDVPYLWTIRITAESAADPERQDLVMRAWEAIFNEYAKSDAICAGGNAQLVFPSAVDPIEVENDGMLYVGIDITLTVIVKKARVFELT